MPKATLPTSTTRTTKTCKPNQSLTKISPPATLPGGGSKTKETMKATKIVHITGAAICCTLAIIFRTIALPIALAYTAFDAMANTSNIAAEQLLDKENTADHNKPE